MNVEQISSLTDFEALRAEWDGLLASSVAANPFLTWEWLFTWWKHFAGGRQLAVLALREGGELVGVAPLCLRRRALASGVPTSVVEFLGTGNVGSDYLDVVARQGRERAAIEASAQHLATLGAALRLSYVRREGAAAAGIGRELRRLGWSLEHSRTDVCPYIPLAGHTWETYLATLGHEHRYTVRRKLRTVGRRYRARFEEARTDDERREALRILVDLHLKRWTGRGGSDAFHTMQLVGFHEEFTRLALARGWLRLFVLRLDGVPAGALYGLRYARTFFFYQSGLNPEFARESPGLICMAMAIHRAIDEGAEEYDMLRGAEAYKLHWARQARMLGRFDLFPSHLGGVLWKQARMIRRSLRRVARRLRPVPSPATPGR